jgi:hypothetical protein
MHVYLRFVYVGTLEQCATHTWTLICSKVRVLQGKGYSQDALAGHTALQSDTPNKSRSAFAAAGEFSAMGCVSLKTLVTVSALVVGLLLFVCGLNVSCEWLQGWCDTSRCE